MTNDQEHVLDAALDAFLRYGFKRTTMSDIAQAAGLSRQSLYARFANKDEVYAAGLILFGDRILAQLKEAWTASPDIADVMDAFVQISVIPTYQMLQHNPDAADLIEAAATPDGKAAMDQVTKQKCAALAEMFAPHATALAAHGLTPLQLADFVEAFKHAIIQSAKDDAHLAAQLATLKASVLSLTSR